MDAPRISPGGFSDLGLVNWAICRVIARTVRVPDAHLFSTVGRQHGLFRAWLRFAAQLMPRGTLSRRETELVILRVAHLRSCDYELDHHLRIGRRVGLDPEALARVAHGPDAPGWDERQRALLRAVDSLVTVRSIDDEKWDALREHYDERNVVELCFLVGHYDMLAMTITALRIQRDFG